MAKTLYKNIASTLELKTASTSKSISTLPSTPETSQTGCGRISQNPSLCAPSAQRCVRGYH